MERRHAHGRVAVENPIEIEEGPGRRRLRRYERYGPIRGEPVLEFIERFDRLGLRGVGARFRAIGIDAQFAVRIERVEVGGREPTASARAFFGAFGEYVASDGAFRVGDKGHVFPEFRLDDPREEQLGRAEFPLSVREDLAEPPRRLFLTRDRLTGDLFVPLFAFCAFRGGILALFRRFARLFDVF